MLDWGRKWKINLGLTPLDTAVFTLVKRRSDAFIYYSMEFEKGGDEAWWDCALVQHGINHLTWAPLAPLPVWHPSHTALYDAGIAAFLTRVAASTRRLVGEVIPMTMPPAPTSEIIVDGIVAPVQVTVLLAKDAIYIGPDKQRDLLILVTESQDLLVCTEGGPGGPDGTAHGDPD
jgi:hypothetical protein